MEALVSVPPKPMVVGGRVFGEEGWKPALLELAFIIICLHRKKMLSSVSVLLTCLLNCVLLMFNSLLYYSYNGYRNSDFFIRKELSDESQHIKKKNQR